MEDVVLFTLLSFRIKEKNLNITQGYHANIFFFFFTLWARKTLNFMQTPVVTTGFFFKTGHLNFI